MTDATVNDELTFEALPDETKELVYRLYEVGYFGESDEDKIEDLEDTIEDLEGQVEELNSKIWELEQVIEELEEELEKDE